jgi:hypothetical protein
MARPVQLRPGKWPGCPLPAPRGRATYSLQGKIV